MPKIKKPKIALFHLTSLLALSSLHEIQASIVTYYDIGSSGTKYSVYNYDEAKQEYTQLHHDVIPVHYALDLAKSKDTHFSDDIQAKGIQTIQLIKEYVCSKYAGCDKIECYGVATAAWRSAKNAKGLRDKVYEKTGVPVKIICQTEEGELVYEGATAHLARNDAVVWDIGGGSMQFVTRKKDSTEVIVAGSVLATQTFTNKIREQIKHIGQYDTPNPMNENEINHAITLAKSELGLNPESEIIVKTNIKANEGIVYGASPIHKSTIAKTLEMINGRPYPFFTPQDLADAIKAMANLRDDEMAVFLEDNPDPQFIKSHLPCMILVYASMEALGIQKVLVTETNITEGILKRGPKFISQGFQNDCNHADCQG